jgi:hypothetical protein
LQIRAAVESARAEKARLEAEAAATHAAAAEELAAKRAKLNALKQVCSIITSLRIVHKVRGRCRLFGRLGLIKAQMQPASQDSCAKYR